MTAYNLPFTGTTPTRKHEDDEPIVCTGRPLTALTSPSVGAATHTPDHQGHPTAMGTHMEGKLAMYQHTLARYLLLEATKGDVA